MKQVLVLAIYSKFLLYLIIFLAASLLPYSKEFYEPNFIYPPGEKHSMISAYKSWDAQHYLFLIEEGYGEAEESRAFFPLYPLLSSLIALLIGNSFIAALFVSFAASLIGVYYFYRFVRQFYTKEDTLWASLFLLSFPTAYYLSLIYSEAVFLALITAFMYYLYKGDYRKAGIIAFFIPLARPIGVFIAFPFITYFLLDKKKRKTPITLPSFATPVSLTFFPQIIYLLLPFLGVLTYLILMWILAGDPFAGIAAQRQYVLGFALENLLSPVSFLKMLFTPELSLHAFHISVIDRLFFLFFLVLVPFMYKYLDKTLFVFALSFGLIPLLGSFMAYPRYLLIVFPLYIVLTRLTKGKHTIRFMILFTFFSLQIFFTILYALNYWVF